MKVQSQNLSRAKRAAQLLLVVSAVFMFMGAGDDNARFDDLGHKLMCMCSCNQILLECNHVGCQYSERMRGELMAALDHGDNDSLSLQSFVQKYGTTVLAAPTETGFNRVAWIMPYAALLLGITSLVVVVRSWRSRVLPAHAGAVMAVHGAELDRFRDQARRDTDL